MHPPCSIHISATGRCPIDSIGDYLRALRQARGLTLAALADRMAYSPGYLHNVETGTRRATGEFLAAADQALGTTPVLVTLATIREDPMRRRALMGMFSAAVTAAVVAADGHAALAATLHHALTGNAASDDPQALADAVTRRQVLHPADPALGPEIAAHLAVVGDRAADDPAAARAAARLALVYGLWLGDTGRTITAHAYYSTAAILADQSGHAPTAALVRARAASRGLYEGWSARQASDAIRAALDAHPHGPAAVEAHSAAVHLAALTGNAAGGRAALAAMTAAATTDDDHRRAAHFAVYLPARLGDLDAASDAYATAAPLLRTVPLWRADASLYLARARVASGDAHGGLTLALDALATLRRPVHVLGIGAADVLSALPAGHRSDPADALATHTPGGPYPWETL